MKKQFGSLLLKAFGWTVDTNVPEEAYGKCVMLAAPHTSNWDFPFAISAMAKLGIDIRYTIKREWMRSPMGLLFWATGAIGVNRKPKIKGDHRTSMVDAIAQLFEDKEKLCIIMQPEGTRALTTKWKTGFYYTALKAKVPIVLGWLDFEKKQAGIGKAIHPSGDLDKDMREIMAFYKDIKGKHPEKFALDERYV
jgi:1-acyl-sn-glycerol-3-phosphate acyltransferase